MWLILVVLLSLYATVQTLSLFADELATQLALFAVYALASEFLHMHGSLFYRAARHSLLARCVQMLAPVVYTAESRAVMTGLVQSKRQIMFCVAPHGPLCLGLAVGFGGHCGQMPAELSDRLRIVAHTSVRVIPFVRELASVFGFISSSRLSVEAALRQNQHLALIPAGMASKTQTLVDRPVPPNAIVVHRERLGFLALAARKNMLVVPVLAPDENNLYRLYGTQLGLWPLTLVVGRLLLLPRMKLELHFGTPIDAGQFKTNLDTLEALYHKQLRQLAPPGYRVEFRQVGDDNRQTNSSLK